jgi:hypothetical protein
MCLALSPFVVPESWESRIDVDEEDDLIPVYALNNWLHART